MTQDPNEQKAEAGASPGLSANLPGLELFLQAWTHESNGISTDGINFEETSPWTGSTAGDVITTEYLDTLQRAHGEFLSHNGMMSNYSEVYREKFEECLQSMSNLDQAEAQKYFRSLFW